MSELIEIGGIPPDENAAARGLWHGDCMTVTGKTMAESLADVADYPADQKIIRPLSNPIKKDSHLVILRGNLAPEWRCGENHRPRRSDLYRQARCFHGEEAAMAAIMDGTVVMGDVVIVRWAKAKRWAGHARNVESHQCY